MNERESLGYTPEQIEQFLDPKNRSDGGIQRMVEKCFLRPQQPPHLLIKQENRPPWPPILSNSADRED